MPHSGIQRGRSPLHLLLVLLFPGLSLHLLHLSGVGLAATHIQLMVAHAQGQDALVDVHTRGIEHKILTDGKRGLWGRLSAAMMPLALITQQLL